MSLWPLCMVWNTTALLYAFHRDTEAGWEEEERVAFGLSCVSYFPSRGNDVLLAFAINGLLMGGYVVSGTSVMNFTQRYTEYSSIPLKFPWQRTTHHWSTTFTLSPSFWTTFVSLSTPPIIPVLIRFHQCLLRLNISNMHRAYFSRIHSVAFF